MSESSSTHNTRGRFAAGNPGGPGRPRGSKKRYYAEALTNHLSLERWDEIVERAVKDAVNGDHRARLWLAEHLIGKPTPTLDLHGTDAALVADAISAVVARGLSPTRIFETLLEELADEPPVAPSRDQDDQ